MSWQRIVFIAALVGGRLAWAQTAPPKLYTPPTHQERFQTYVRHTFGLGSILEAGVRAGIDQGLHRPAAWELGAKGYAERFGSAMGVHVVRGTMAYALGEALGEDLRYVRSAPHASAGDRFTAALANTFTARKGKEGHREFSVARFVGPIAAGPVSSTWRPNGFHRGQVVREIGFTYGLGFMRNLVREMAHR